MQVHLCEVILTINDFMKHYEDTGKKNLSSNEKEAVLSIGKRLVDTVNITPFKSEITDALKEFDLSGSQADHFHPRYIYLKRVNDFLKLYESMGSGKGL